MRFSTRLILASLLGLAGVATNVDAHSKLVSPTAWNAQPSKSNTCGVGANANAANPANFRKTVLGNTVEIKWDVVIGDGRGPITAKLDTTAKVNPTVRDFTVDLQATTTNLQPRVGSYTVTFTIPNNIQCTGPDNTCTMRVASSSNWVACATIQLQGQLPQPATQPPPVVTQPPPVVTEAPTEPSTPTNPATDPPATDPVTQPPPAVTDAPATDPPVTAAPTTPTPIRDPTEYYPYASKLNTCQIATNLKICTNINGQSIQLMGVDLATVESQAIEQIDLNLLNPSVLERPNTDGCLEALTDMICAQMFPPCRSDSTVVCTSTCQRVNNLCKPNATEIIDDQGGRSSHAELFDCNNINLGFTEINADSTGNCPAVDTGIRPTQTTTKAPGTGTGTTTAPGTTRKPVSLSSTGPGRNHASSLKSSFTVVMGVVTLLLAFVVPV